MSREARMMSGIILITVPTIQYGGYFLLTSLMNKGSGYMGGQTKNGGPIAPGLRHLSWC